MRQLTTLPTATEDLPEIIDKAGDYLIDKDDMQAALDLYLAAVKVYPGVALYHSAAGYCLGKLGDRKSAAHRIRRGESRIDRDLAVAGVSTARFVENSDMDSDSAHRRAPMVSPEGRDGVPHR